MSVFDLIGLAVNGKHQQVPYLKEYLVHYGYLAKCDLDEANEEFCDASSVALSHFQQVWGLRRTGTMNPETALKIMTPRCANPDNNLIDLVIGRKKKQLRPCAFIANETIGYSFDSHHHASTQLSPAEQEAAIFDAFVLWSNAIALNFSKNHNGRYNFAFGWRDNQDIDRAFAISMGYSTQYAHAFPPSPSSFLGQCHFSLKHDLTHPCLVGVALHEIGHLLGLEHSNDIGDLMYPDLATGWRRIPSADLAALDRICDELVRTGFERFLIKLRRMFHK